MLYATCATASATAAKVATLSSGALTLTAGATVAVRFTNANTASSPTLNVGGTGQKPSTHRVYAMHSGPPVLPWYLPMTDLIGEWRPNRCMPIQQRLEIRQDITYILMGQNIWFRCGSTVLAAYNSAEITSVMEQ